MKKSILVIVFALIANFSFGQGLDFGIKAGVNFSTLTDAAGLDNRTGFVGGVFIGGKLGDKLGIQADLLYSQQGAEFNVGDFDLNYINVPIVLKYFVTDKLHIHAGPQFGVLIDENARTVVGTVIDKIGTNDTDVSAVIGAGLDLPLGIRLDGRYNFGLTDVPDDAGKGITKGKNSVFTLSVGYSFL